MIRPRESKWIDSIWALFQVIQDGEMKMFQTGDSAMTIMSTQAGKIAVLNLPSEAQREPPAYSQTEKPNWKNKKK